jgi:hypothetical protein
MNVTSGTNPGSGSTPVSSTTPQAGSTPSSGANPPAVTPPAVTPAASLPIALKVNFTLTTPDGLRQIGFGLEKDTDGTKVDWTITFVLYERTDATKPFGDPLVSLTVFVATTLQANAETAAHDGLTPAQTAHATGPAADAAKAVQAGTMSLPAGNTIIQNTLK